MGMPANSKVLEKKVIEGFNKNSVTKIKATLGIWQGKAYIDIREHLEQEGDFSGATRKGIHFDMEDWGKFKELVNQIDKEIRERNP